MRPCEVGEITPIFHTRDSLLLCLMSLIHSPQCQGLPPGLWLVQVQKVVLICWPASWTGGAKQEEKKHDIAITTRVKIPGSLQKRYHLPAQPEAGPLPRLMSACMWGHAHDCIYRSVSITWPVVHSQSHGPTWIIQKAKRPGRWSLWGCLIQPKEHQSGTWNGYTHFPFLAVVIWRVIQLSKCNALWKTPGYPSYVCEAVMSESHSRPLAFFLDQQPEVQCIL